MLCTSVWAQVTVRGKVTDSDDGALLPGVNILEQGTTNGTTSDVEGNYTITVSNDAVLVFSFVGYKTQEEIVGPRSVIDVSLEVDITTLSEIVVTAFGLEKKTKSLGYSTTEIGGEELVEAREISVASQLTGKIAGVEVNTPVTGPAGSTNILIRGMARLSTGETRTENRPLIVVDGIPIDNTNINAASQFGGRDSGDGFSSLNQDDIESINVLKGAAANTLFGERGANGAIIITTKQGTARKGIGVEYNGNFVFENALILPEFQQEYGQGQLGVRPSTRDEAVDNSASWGERFDGELTPFFDGVSRPYSAVGNDDLRNFYETGSTITNTLALTGGNEKVTARLSLSNLVNESIIPNTEYEKSAVNLVTTAHLTDKLTIAAKANYIREEATNRPNLSDNPSNPGKSFSLIPANISVDMLRNAIRDEDGNPIQWTDNVFALNPFWGPLENVNDDRRNRLIGFARISYAFTDWLTLQLRYGTDTYTHRFFNIEEDGTAHNISGSLWEDIFEIREDNLDFLIMVNKNITEDLGLSANIGGVQTKFRRERFGVSGNDFAVVGLHVVNNMNIQNPGTYELSETETNAFFGTALLDYKGFLFLEGAIRQDWYSTLTNPNDPGASDNTALYGSGSLSFAFSDVMKLPSFFTLGKLRVAYGSGGNGAPNPYSTALTYRLDPFSYNLPNGRGSVALGEVGSPIFPNPSLSPTRTRSFEVGADLSFFEAKLGVDVTYYQQNTIDQIFDAAVPNSTGYNNRVVNAGEVQNRGLEVLITANPVSVGDFSWNISANYTRNRNEIISLTEGIDNLTSESARFSANLISRVGGMVGDIFGTVFERNENGEIVHDEEGLPVIANEREVLGNFAPDWYGGITNTFNYKNLSLSFLVDIKQGGEVYSITNALAYSNGKHVNTLVGRENPLFEIQGRGVGPDGDTPNQEFARLDLYYNQFAAAAEESIFDASYIKLRQVSIGYSLPSRLLSNVPFNSVRISLVGRNLFFFKNGLSDIGLDPEALYTISNSGFEYGTTPSTRSFGVNLSLKL